MFVHDSRYFLRLFLYRVVIFFDSIEHFYMLRYVNFWVVCGDGTWHNIIDKESDRQLSIGISQLSAIYNFFAKKWKFSYKIDIIIFFGQYPNDLILLLTKWPNLGGIPKFKHLKNFIFFFKSSPLLLEHETDLGFVISDIELVDNHAHITYNR